ncbi:MAG: hypothetical protein HY074_14660 [Deltaproteobacteria bacterium]|nr:hypothetical protein [Deltaproteobacteria bacterium]
MTTALKEGASAVEFDLQLSRDGVVVLAHDDKLQRMTDGHGCVADKDFTELEKLSLRDGTGKVHPDHMAGFREALEALKSYDDHHRPFLADIHIKVYDGFKGDWGGVHDTCPVTKYAELTHKTLAVLKAYDLLDRVFFTSFDDRVLDLIKKESPKSVVGLLSDFRPGHAIKRAIGRYDAVSLAAEHLTADEVKNAHQHGLLVYAWSPAKEEEMEKLFAVYQVDGVITDNLPNALRACKKSCYNRIHE